MMNWNWRDLDDVDDLIFTDAGWKQKTVEKTEKSKKMNGIFLKTVIR